jgi:molybdopterin-guanine dinucleotide biosynthesis protein A
LPLVAAFSGAVLTGGESRRMGADKAFVTVDGVAMVIRVATTLRRAGATSVRTIGGDLTQLRELGLDAEPDPRQGDGPLGGLVTALEAATEAIAAVLATDLAWLRPEVVQALVDRLGLDPAADVAAAHGGRREPLCAVWRIDPCLDELRDAHLAGERAVHRAMERLSVAEVTVDPATVRNANHPEDLHQ